MVNIRKIVKKVIPTEVFKKIEPTGHLIESVTANIKHGFPSKDMHIIGVTGTNGKTTTTNIIFSMLKNAGYKVGLLSTVAYGYGDKVQPQIEHITTAQAGILQSRLKEMKNAGVQWVVLETSSHSLSQYRTWGVPYEIAVMTNITGDHLDYHGTFENYLEAKLRLFKLAAKNGMKLGIINADDPNADKFTTAIPNSVSYGVEKGDVHAENIKLSVDHIDFTAVCCNENYNIHVNIPGDFNVSNSLAAVSVGRALGLSKEQIEKGIASLTGVEGRMALINEGQPYKIVIDHASTPDAFERFFENVRPVTKGKLIAVFGSAGRRDEAKRPVQGEIAAKFSDEVIITEEDDRDIDGNEIMQQIAAGAIKAGKVENKNLFLILDRKKAIEFALNRAKNPEDTVVLLGKGHEKTIERNDGEYPWNETYITKELLKDMIK